MTLDETKDLYDFLRGGPPPDGICISRYSPSLSAKAAFSVIYVLQEKYRLISDSFEQCSRCRELFDSNESGHYDEKSGKHYCDDHIPVGKSGG